MGHRYRDPKEDNTLRLTPESARALLESCGIAVGADYVSLTQTQTAPLLAEADRRGYRPPRGSTMSLTWHFYHYVDRTVRRASRGLDTLAASSHGDAERRGRAMKR